MSYICKMLTTEPGTQYKLHNYHLLSRHVVGLEEEAEFELELQDACDWAKTAVRQCVSTFLCGCKDK